MRTKDALGRYGEQLVADRLASAGWRLLDRNWRCPAGELDIVALDRDELVFVEVKTRSSTAFGVPAEAVTAAKAGRIRRLAAQWMDEHRAGEADPDDPATGARAFWRSVRFDVVAVVRERGGSADGPAVEHLYGAF